MAGNGYLEAISIVMLYKDSEGKNEITWEIKVAKEGKRAGTH